MSTALFPARAPETRMRKSTRRAAALAVELITQDKMAPGAACKEAGISLRTLERYREAFVVEAARPEPAAVKDRALTLFTEEQALVLATIQESIARLDKELSGLLELMASHATSVAQNMRSHKMLREFDEAERDSAPAPSGANTAT